MASVREEIERRNRLGVETFQYFGSLLTNFRLFQHDKEYRRVFCPSWTIVTEGRMTRARAVNFIAWMSWRATRFYQAVGVPSRAAPYDVKAWVYGPEFRFEQERSRQHPLVPSTLPYTRPLGMEIQVRLGYAGAYREWARLVIPGVEWRGGGGEPITVPNWPSISGWIADQLDVEIPGVGISVIVGAPNWQGKGIPPAFTFGYEYSLIDALSFGWARMIPIL